MQNISGDMKPTTSDISSPIFFGTPTSHEGELYF
jgi:hypothetical protein